MYYWNQDNFDGLKSVGDRYSSLDGYEHFGRYCIQKERGLKKLALSAVQEFVSLSKSRSIKEQRIIAEELSSLAFWNGQIHQLLPHPLVEFIKAVLELWTLDEPDNPIPYKWLGYICRKTSFYERALELDPEDEICISRVALAHLNDVDFQTHHLSESIFLGDYNDAKNSLHLAHLLITTLSTENLRSSMQNELEYYNRLLNCWEEYSKLNIEQPFQDWCASKGEKFNFLSVVYYDQ